MRYPTTFFVPMNSMCMALMHGQVESVKAKLMMHGDGETIVLSIVTVGEWPQVRIRIRNTSHRQVLVNDKEIAIETVIQAHAM